MPLNLHGMTQQVHHCQKCQRLESSELAQNGLPQLAVENYGASVTQSTQSSADAEAGGDKSTRRYDTQQEFESEVVIPFGDEEPAYSSDYTYDENIPSPESEPKPKLKLKPAQESNEPFDLSDAIAQTSIQFKATKLEYPTWAQILGGDLWQAIAPRPKWYRIAFIPHLFGVSAYSQSFAAWIEASKNVWEVSTQVF